MKRLPQKEQPTLEPEELMGTTIRADREVKVAEVDKVKEEDQEDKEEAAGDLVLVEETLVLVDPDQEAVLRALSVDTRVLPGDLEVPAGVDPLPQRVDHREEVDLPLEAVDVVDQELEDPGGHPVVEGVVEPLIPKLVI